MSYDIIFYDGDVFTLVVGGYVSNESRTLYM